jgi:membrane protease subunit HflC
MTRIVLFVVLAVVGVLGLIAIVDAAYSVDEGEQVVVLQFGRPIGDPVTEPGLHFKTPFVQEVRRFEKRRLAWDGDPNQIPTRGREFISVDTTARWRVVDALQFMKSVQDESGAQSRLDDVIDSVVRDKISSTDLVEIVRSKDWKITQEDLDRIVVTEREGAEQLTKPVEVGRELLTRAILEEAKKVMPQYGIELVDVRIKRLNYIPSVQKQVFDRMIAERQRIAEEFRSEGEGEAARIRGQTALQLASIRSEAKREAEVVRGQADAEATRVYAAAFGADPEFYEFSRSLDAYAKSLDQRVTLILDAEGELFRYLRDAKGTPK